MKELTKEFQDNTVEIVSEKEQRKEIKLIDQQRRVRGLTLWEFNTETKELIKAKFKTQNVSINAIGDKSYLTEHSKVVVNEGCIYFQALNMNNAKKKLRLL